MSADLERSIHRTLYDLPLWRWYNFDNTRLHTILVNFVNEFLEASELVHGLQIAVSRQQSQKRNGYGARSTLLRSCSQPVILRKIGRTGLKTGTLPPS